MTEQIDYKERRKLLIDALESNEYTQRKGMMRDQNGCMCIHGLMCEVYRQNSDTTDEWTAGRARYGSGDINHLFGDPRTWTIASPRYVPEWFGFADEGEPRVFLAWAMARNDQKGWTFQQFADELKRIDA